jgi:hypothetical protein
VKIRRYRQAGQSIFEVVIALAIGAILIIGAVTAISVTLKADVEETSFQTANFLNQELLNNASIIAQSNWRAIADLDKSPTQYYISVSSGSFATSSGSENISVDEKSFTRYFTLENVSRDPATQNIETTYQSVNDDPATQRITVSASWTTSGGSTETSQITKYLTRHTSEIYRQTAWSWGTDPVLETVSLPDSGYEKFATSTNIATTTGAIKIQGL